MARLRPSAWVIDANLLWVIASGALAALVARRLWLETQQHQ
jgi:hypothetical protein